MRWSFVRWDYTFNRRIDASRNCNDVVFWNHRTPLVDGFQPQRCSAIMVRDGIGSGHGSHDRRLTQCRASRLDSTFQLATDRNRADRIGVTPDQQRRCRDILSRKARRRAPASPVGRCWKQFPIIRSPIGRTETRHRHPRSYHEHRAPRFRSASARRTATTPPMDWATGSTGPSILASTSFTRSLML